MQRFIGLACLAIGIMLLVWASQAHDSAGSQIKEAVTGSPTDKTIWLYIGGALLCAVGLGSFFYPKRVR